MANLYINLPVADLAKATAFYEAIGFVKNPSFSNDDGSAMTWDETLSVMLLTHEFYTKFLPVGKVIASNTTSEVLNALQFDSKEAVDAFFDKAIAAGGTKTIDTQDH
jgi:predicted lactoylglutathione lyase